MKNMIEFKEWDKHYGKLKALHNISLQINPSRVTAIVGPNGSGKTTLTKGILGLVKPTMGKLYINGKYLNGDCLYRKDIGYMPQYAKFPENLKVSEVIDMVKNIRGYSKDLDLGLVNPFNLAIEMHKKVGTLSGGTRQKLSALLAFMFHPEIYIFDEPTAGLDPISSIYLKEQILEEKKKGKTIILTSHILSEIEELADDLVFLYEGEIKYTGEVTELMKKTNSNSLEHALANLLKELQK